MKKILLTALLSAIAVTGCATTSTQKQAPVELTPGEVLAKQEKNYKRLVWLLGEESAKRFMDDPNKPFTEVNNKKVTQADQSKYGFDVSIYDYLGEPSGGLIYAVILDPRDNTYKSGYLRTNGEVYIPFKFGHTNKDHLESRQFIGGLASVINPSTAAQIYREEGASHPDDQYAIIDHTGSQLVKYTAYLDIQKYPGDNYFTAIYIDEKGQKRTSKISTNLKLISDVPGWIKK